MWRALASHLTHAQATVGAPIDFYPMDTHAAAAAGLQSLPHSTAGDAASADGEVPWVSSAQLLQRACMRSYV
jgi:hypothetical protein